jgi:hypothetical protein
MNYEQLAQKFDGEFQQIYTVEKDLRVKVIVEIIKKIDEIWPVVQVLKKNNVYFTHPELHDVKTIHGVIIGVNHKNFSEIYVSYDKHYVYKVHPHDDTLDKTGILINRFLEHANLDFAYKGIISAMNRPNEVLNGIEEKMKKYEQILQDLTK